MRTYAALFYALNLGVGVSQMLSDRPDPLLVALSCMGVVSAAVLFAVSV